MKKTILILLTLAAAMMLRAEPLTIDSLMTLARRNSMTLRISQLEIEKAREVKAQVFTKFFPQVSGNAMAYHALNPLLQFGIQDIQSADARILLQALYDLVKEEADVSSEITLMHHGLTLSATAAQPLFMGGRIVNGNRLAKLGIEAAQLQAEVSERDVLEQVESSFYLVVGLQDKVQTVESALALLDSLTVTVNAALQAGLVTKSDALQVELKKNEMRAKQLQLSNGIELASRLLCQQVGIDYPEGGLQLADEPTSSLPHYNQLLPWVRGAGQRPEGYEFRPERRLLELQIEAETLRKKISIGEALPQVALGGAYYWGNPIKTSYTHNGLLFATAIIPLTQWWETAHKIRHHNLTIRQYEMQQIDLNRQMDLQERQAYNQMTEALALWTSDSTALALAEENYRLSALNYEAGLCTLNDVLQANAVLLQAQNAITDRRISFLTARRRYLDLTGQTVSGASDASSSRPSSQP